MRNPLSYSVAILLSLALHLGLVGALFIDWQPDSERVVIRPQYIEAKLVDLAPKKKASPTKPKAAPKKPRVDLAKKKREEQKRLAKIAAQKTAAKKKRLEQERLKKAEQKRQEQLRLEELRRQQEAERQRKDLEFAEVQAAEEAWVNAQKEEQAVNSYMQLIQQRVTENWSRPPSARLGMAALIRIQLVPTGRVVGVTILKSSGDSAFDRSVEQAVFKVEQFVLLQGMDTMLFEKRFRSFILDFEPTDLRL
jgi:colicin import membrane protein